jgi:hypothetical protein
MFTSINVTGTWSQFMTMNSQGGSGPDMGQKRQGQMSNSIKNNLINGKNQI